MLARCTIKFPDCNQTSKIVGQLSTFPKGYNIVNAFGKIKFSFASASMPTDFKCSHKTFY